MCSSCFMKLPLVPWNKLIGWAFGTVLGMHHEQHMRESSTEVSTVGMMVSRRLWCVHVDAFGAIGFHHSLTRNIR